MVKLETENGCFEAETIKEAQRAERKAARANDRKAAERRKLHDLALVHAAAQGFAILARKAEGKTFPAGWRFCPAGHPNATVHRGNGEFDRSCRLVIETETGKGDWDFYAWRFVGNVENGAGWTMAIAMQREDGSVSLHAVGIIDGEVATAIIPGVDVNEFRRAGEPREEFDARCKPAE